MPLKNVLNLLYENHLMVWHKTFGTVTICKSVFGMAQNIWSQIGLVQNVLGPVEGQGINVKLFLTSGFETGTP